MATAPVVVTYETGSDRITYTWEGIEAADDGAAVGLPPGYDWMVQLGGTLGTGGEISLNVSLDGGTSLGVGQDPGGNPLTMDALGEAYVIAGQPPLVAPGTAAGDGETDLTLTIVGTRTPH